MASNLAHTKLTCVHHERGDMLGLVLAYSSLLPIAIVVYLVAKMHAQRYVHTLFTLAGLVGCEVLARVIKKLVRHPRPAVFCEQLDLCESHGMPSSHAAFVVMASVLAVLGARTAWRTQSPLWRIVIAAELAALVAGSVACIFSRVYLYYHSWDQVAAGSALGLMLGLSWSWIMAQLGQRGMFSRLADMPLAKALLFHDTWGVPPAELLEQSSSLMHSRAKGKDKQQ